MSIRPTIADVARVAGVSKATVSRVLNETSPHIRAETRERVLHAVAALQYRPNSIARSMTIRRTRTVGLLVSDVGNPFYADVVNGFEDHAFEANYDVYICNVRYDIERGTRFIRSLIDKRVDGVVFMSTTMTPSWLDEMDSSSIPAVAVDSQYKRADSCTGSLEVDFQTGIRELVDYLWGLGHRRFAHLSGPLRLHTAMTRWLAFKEALIEHGVSPEDILLIEGNLMMESGRDALQVVMNASPRPTAVFAANDLTALGLLTAAGRHDIRIPADFSLCGLDDIGLAAEVELATVSLNPYQLGQQAMAMLLEHLDGVRSLRDRTEYCVSQLIVRESIAPPPDHSG